MKAFNKIWKVNIVPLSILILSLMLVQCRKDEEMRTPESDPSFFENTIWLNYNSSKSEVELFNEEGMYYSASIENNVINPFIIKAFDDLGVEGGQLFLGEGNFILESTIIVPSGVTITGAGYATRLSYSSTFFSFENVSDVSLEGVVLKGDYNSTSQSNAISVSGNCRAILIDQVEIDSLNGNGIVINCGGEADVEIMGSSITEVTGSGILIEAGSGFLVSGNQVEFAGAAGIAINGGEDILIRDNAISNIDGNAIVVNGTIMTILEGNSITTTGLDAIKILNADDPQVLSNTVTDAGGLGGSGSSSAIYVKSSDGANLEENTTNAASNNGIYIESCSDATITENMLASSGSDAVVGVSITNSNFLNNNVLVTSGNGIKVSGSSNDKSDNVTISENSLQFIGGEAAIFLEYLNDGVVNNNSVVMGTNPATIVLYQGAEVTLTTNEGNEEDNSNPMPIPVCWYKFDTTGGSAYGTTPPRLPDFSSGTPSFINGKQLLFDAGEGSLATSYEEGINMKHTFNYEKINGKYRWANTADPQKEPRLDINNPTLRTWDGLDQFGLSGNIARTATFWLKIDDRVSARPPHEMKWGSAALMIGTQAYEGAASSDDGITITLVEKENEDVYIRVFFNNEDYFDTPVEIRKDRWYHVTLRHPVDAKISDVELLLDGEKASTHNNDPNYDISFNVAGGFLNRIWMTTWFAQGITLSDVRIYDKYVSDEHIDIIMLQ